ncbi:MAG: hypothetical protein WAW37_12685 [Syntrophobacteraceae bacterium]
MRLRFTRSFKRDYLSLPRSIQKATDKQIELLLEDPRHPSLNIKKMHDPRNIWEGRITAGYRFTFVMEADTYVLRRVGTHDLLRRP